MADTDGRPVRLERSEKRVRAYVDGIAVVDTTRPVLVWEVPPYPAYYLPRADVRTDLLRESGRVERAPGRGEAVYSDLHVGDRVIADAAWEYPASPVEELRDLVRLDWDALDAWFEEDEEVFVHPRSPYTRIDVLDSSRRVRVAVEGLPVADTSHPRLLFETGLPTRFYLPRVDVRMDLLVASDTVTRCPYKGVARYWSVRTSGGLVEDVAWSYPAPLPESIRIAGLVCFLDERVDVTVDGVRRERPRTHLS